jgi:hypothetical protein
MNHELKCKLFFTIYCALKLSLVIAYTAIIIYLWNYSIGPLIALHGGWNFLWTMIWTSLTGAITCGLFLMPLPRKPQATPRYSEYNPPNFDNTGDTK